MTALLKFFAKFDNLQTMSKKIIVNGVAYCIQNITGVERVAIDMMSALDEFAQKGEMEIVLPKNAKSVPTFKNITVTLLDKNFESITKWEQWDFQNYVRKQKGIPLDFCNSMPYYVPGIVYLHDIYCKLHPNNYKSLYEKIVRSYTCRLYRRIAKKALKIVTVSNFSKDTIVDVYKIDPERIVVINNGISPNYTATKADKNILNKFPELKKRPFYFMLGALSERKNLKWVLRHAKLYPDDFFAISGTSISDNECSILDSLKALKNVLMLGYLSDAETKALMEKCKAFIFPSFFEGFGMPPLEALNCGAKIIISNAAALPQIYKNTAYYIDPEDPNTDLDELLEKKVDSPKILIDKLTSQNAAIQLYSVIKEVCQKYS